MWRHLDDVNCTQLMMLNETFVTPHHRFYRDYVIGDYAEWLLSVVKNTGWGMGFQRRDGVPDMGWGSRPGMWYLTQVGFQTWDDGVPDRWWSASQGWDNNIYEAPKWNSSLLDIFGHWIQRIQWKHLEKTPLFETDMLSGHCVVFCDDVYSFWLSTLSEKYPILTVLEILLLWLSLGNFSLVQSEFGVQRMTKFFSHRYLL